MRLVMGNPLPRRAKEDEEEEEDNGTNRSRGRSRSRKGRHRYHIGVYERILWECCRRVERPVA